MNLLWRITGRAIFIAVLPLLALFVSHKERARVLVVNELDEVLLVKGVFSFAEWELPGGGVKPGESLRAAAVRELREEVGLTIEGGSLVELGSIKTTHRIAAMRLRVYAVRLEGSSATVSSYEIADLKWWPLTALPEDAHNNIAEAISLWSAQIS